MRILGWSIIVICLVAVSWGLVNPAKTAPPVQVDHGKIEKRVEALEAKVKNLEPKVKNIEDYFQRRGSRY